MSCPNPINLTTTIPAAVVRAELAKAEREYLELDESGVGRETDHADYGRESDYIENMRSLSDHIDALQGVLVYTEPQDGLDALAHAAVLNGLLSTHFSAEPEPENYRWQLRERNIQRLAENVAKFLAQQTGLTVQGAGWGAYFHPLCEYGGETESADA